MKHSKSWLSLALSTLLLSLTVGVQSATSSPTETNRTVSDRNNSARHTVFVDPGLQKYLDRSGSADLFVYMSDKADLSAAHGMSWEERGWYVYETLSAHAELTQANVRRELDAAGMAYKPFWIENLIHVKAAPVGLLNDLARMSGVEAIISPPVGYIPEPEERLDDNTVRAPISSITQIRAPEVWAMGFRGAGSVVGIIDSGTRHTHVALVNQYRGNTGSGFDHNYNWYDVGGSTSPTFPDPHGTHVTGTAIGDDGAGNQIGVAPEAKWVSCLGCTGTGCPGANLLSCAQFMAAPTDLAGNNPDPSLRPDVVNNSWGGCSQSYDPWYQGAVDAWIAAGIVPVFANGNAGNCGYSSPPGLNTVGNPGRYGSVLGVGSSGNNNGLYANHSNWGPTDNLNDGTNSALPDPMGHPELKPNVIAPGVSIFSSVSSSDTAFASAFWTGTSMSAPAVAGLVALMWEAAPPLRGDYATTGTLIMQTARPVPYNSGGPNVGPGNVPNHATGWGEIDALAAVEAALAFAGPRGTVTGQVTEFGSGDPIAGASVFVTNDDPDGAPASWSTTTDAFGNYSLTLSEGFRDFEFSAFGYLPATESGVEIIEDQTTVVDMQLASAPSVEISGTISDDFTGWPLHARISIDGVPSSPIYSSPADGSYSITLPSGSIYDFDVHVLSGGYISKNRQVNTSAGTDLTENFSMDADQLACSAPGYENQAPPFYSQDFVADDGGFVSSGTNNDWQWGTPTAWPNSCVAGSTCWGTNLTGNYLLSANNQLQSPVINLSAATAPITLTWQQANHTDTSTFHPAFAEFRINGGPWQVMWANTTSTAAVNWRELSYDLSAAAGQSVELRWRRQADSIGGFPGIFIDDIKVNGEPDCQPQIGELVSGRITDANTGEPLLGVSIVVNGDISTSTAVSEDPTLGEGAYIAFVPAGSSAIGASSAGYEAGEFADDFIDGEARRVDFALGAGSLNTNPESVSRAVGFGGTGSSVLSLINAGSSEAGFTATAVDLLRQNFESAFPPAGWSVENLGGNCVWLRNDTAGRANFAGGDGFSAAADSDACGTGSTMDTALISPPVSVGADTTLDFVVSYRHLGTSRLDIDVSANGGAWSTIQTYSADLSGQGPGAAQSLDLSAFAGDQVQLRFRYVATSWDWWAQVDQIEVRGAVDWLGVSPADGMVTSSSNTPLTLNFDAGAASITSLGEYNASILIENDTPYGTLVVPVTMVVLAMNPPIIDVDPQSLSVSLAEGQSDTRNISISNSGEADLNWFIDDTTAGCESPGWASTTPTTGSVVQGGSDSATVTFDATGLAPAVYEATLCVASNDPATPIVEVALALTVETMSTVQGSVTSLGYCGATPAPAAGAGILIQGEFDNYAGTVDGDGFYSITLPADESPVTVTATAMDHLAEVETNVVLTAGQTVDLGFELILEAACATVNPASLEFYDVTTMSQNLTVGNANGAASLTWSVASGAACYDAGSDTWLSLSSSGDSMAAGASQLVQVSVDSNGLAPGLYETVICMATSDSQADEILVPVSLDLRSDALFQDRFQE